ERAELAADRGDLERAGETAMRARRHAEARDVLAGEADLSRRGAHLAGELRDQRRLAGAVGTDHRVQLALGDSEREAVSRGDAAEALDEVYGLEQRASHRGRVRQRARRGRVWRTAPRG